MFGIFIINNSIIIRRPWPEQVANQHTQKEEQSVHFQRHLDFSFHFLSCNVDGRTLYLRSGKSTGQTEREQSTSLCLTARKDTKDDTLESTQQKRQKPKMRKIQKKIAYYIHACVAVHVCMSQSFPDRSSTEQKPNNVFLVCTFGIWKSISMTTFFEKRKLNGNTGRVRVDMREWMLCCFHHLCLHSIQFILLSFDWHFFRFAFRKVKRKLCVTFPTKNAS